MRPARLQVRRLARSQQLHPARELPPSPGQVCGRLRQTTATQQKTLTSICSFPV